MKILFAFVLAVASFPLLAGSASSRDPIQIYDPKANDSNANGKRDERPVLNLENLGRPSLENMPVEFQTKPDRSRPPVQPSNIRPSPPVIPDYLNKPPAQPATSFENRAAVPRITSICFLTVTVNALFRNITITAGDKCPKTALNRAFNLMRTAMAKPADAQSTMVGSGVFVVSYNNMSGITFTPAAGQQCSKGEIETAAERLAEWASKRGRK